MVFRILTILKVEHKLNFDSIIIMITVYESITSIDIITELSQNCLLYYLF